jgi:hypothetical protein
MYNDEIAQWHNGAKLWWYTIEALQRHDATMAKYCGIETSKH